LRQQLTTASDVYAYGVVLLELITGQKAIDHMRSEEINLIGWVRSDWNNLYPSMNLQQGVNWGFVNFCGMEDYLGKPILNKKILSFNIRLGLEPPTG
jgi:hypothetical protein